MQRQYMEQMAYDAVKLQIGTIGRDSHPSAWWRALTGIGSTKHGDAAPKVDTGLHEPDDVFRAVMQRIVREGWAEPTPGRQGEYRAVPDQGRNTSATPKWTGQR